MYRLLIIQFIRTKTFQLSIGLILILGTISIITGKQFLNNQAKTAEQVVEKQLEHIERNVDLHGDDLPLLMYYLKFTLVNPTSPLAGFSIGQRDLNPSVQTVKILTLEGQKYDSDLVNPTQLLYGNLDFSFLLVYIFPLLIIAFTFNLFSEENESGTWKIVKVMAKSESQFLVAKISVRFLILLFIYCFFLATGAIVFGVEFNAEFITFILTGLLYIVFWFSLCFAIICLKKSSNFNALALLAVWMLIVIMLPAFVNNAIINQYPIPEAYSTVIKQRDGYHNKWDTNKRKTLERFYADYPQFAHFGFPSEEGFNWTWYYAMQHLGDVESREESNEMHAKINQREKTSEFWGKLIPSMHTQLVLNKVSKTGLSNHMNFLAKTHEFHENTRLYFYPKIFANERPDQVEWEKFEPEYAEYAKGLNLLASILPLMISILLFSTTSLFLIRSSGD